MSAEVGGCYVGLRAGIASSRNFSADGISFRVSQFARRSPRVLPNGDPPPTHVSGPNQNSWGESYDLVGARVGHTYRHGPVIIRVLSVWDSPVNQYRRAYLNVSFDESKIVCPPVPAQTVEE